MTDKIGILTGRSSNLLKQGLLRPANLRADRGANRISHARVVTFLAAGVCFLAGWLGESGDTVQFVAGGVLSTAFLSLVCLHDRVPAPSSPKK